MTVVDLFSGPFPRTAEGVWASSCAHLQEMREMLDVTRAKSYEDAVLTTLGVVMLVTIVLRSTIRIRPAEGYVPRTTAYRFHPSRTTPIRPTPIPPAPHRFQLDSDGGPRAPAVQSLVASRAGYGVRPASAGALGGSAGPRHVCCRPRRARHPTRDAHVPQGPARRPVACGAHAHTVRPPCRLWPSHTR